MQIKFFFDGSIHVSIRRQKLLRKRIMSEYYNLVMSIDHLKIIKSILVEDLTVEEDFHF